MQFKTLATAALAFATGTQAALTASQVTVNIKTVTSLSSDTNNMVSSINGFNIFAVGPGVIDNFRKIVQAVTSDISAMGMSATGGTAMAGTSGTGASYGGTNGGTSAGTNTVYAVSDQQGICDAFRDFVVVHQQLLATVIGKHSFFANTPFTAPVAAVLRTIEGGVDTLAFGLIDLVPTCAADAAKNKAGLDASLEKSIAVYSS